MLTYQAGWSTAPPCLSLSPQLALLLLPGEQQPDGTQGLEAAAREMPSLNAGASLCAFPAVPLRQRRAHRLPAAGQRSQGAVRAVGSEEETRDLPRCWLRLCHTAGWELHLWRGKCRPLQPLQPLGSASPLDLPPVPADWAAHGLCSSAWFQRLAAGNLSHCKL